MTHISDERLAEIVGAGVPCVPIETWEVAHVVQELRSLRAQGGVRVKPLEWQKSEIIGWNGDWHTVPTAYSIRCADENGWKWSGFGGFGYERSDEAAKAAAQADYERSILASLEASPAPVREKWLDPSTAPKDGTVIRLLVKPDMEAFTSLQDSEDAFETIGFNHFDESGEDTWHFAGWDWSHDCITQGHGDVIGWTDFMASPNPVSEEMLVAAVHAFEEAEGHAPINRMKIALRAALAAKGGQ